jgi:ankyrin repeat protein
MNAPENVAPSFTVLLQNGEIDRFKQRILSEPDSLESEDEWGETPLSSAIRAGNVGLVAFLIGQGSNVNHDLPDGETYLTRAMRAKENSLALARQLLDAGADAGPRGPELRTALHWAASVDAWEVGDLLIQRGANVNATDLDDETPLHSAAFSGDARMVRLLLRAGADRSIRAAWSGTAEETARGRGHNDAVRVFQEIPQSPDMPG